MNRIFFLMIILLTVHLFADQNELTDVLSRINDHPRLWVNESALNEIEQELLRPESAPNDAGLADIKSRVINHYRSNETYIKTYGTLNCLKAVVNTPLDFEKQPIFQQKAQVKLSFRDWGHEAFAGALIAQLKGHETYLDSAKSVFFAALVTYSHYHTFEGKPLSNSEYFNTLWYSFSRQSLIAAYDLLYPRLTAEEQHTAGLAILNMVELLQEEKLIRSLNLNSPVPLPQAWKKINWPRNNTREDIEYGLYGQNSLLWYAGLALYNEGIDDDRALKFLKHGYGKHKELLEFRKRSYGNGSSSPAINYSTQGYVVTELNFFRSWRSAFNEHLAHDYPHNYTLFKWAGESYFTGVGGDIYVFGISDVDKVMGNRFIPESAYCNLLEILWLYRDDDRFKQYESYLKQLKHRLFTYLKRKRVAPRYSGRFYTPLLISSEPFIENKSGQSDSVVGHYFDKPGQLIVKSSDSADATRAIFIAGGGSENYISHRHYDEGSFVIYKSGFLALDAGSRYKEGRDDPWFRDSSRLVQEVASQHINHYSSQSVAHNTLLIDGRDGKLPYYGWGSGYTKIDHWKDREHEKVYGGMINQISTLKNLKITGNFAYAHADLTKSYYDNTDQKSVERSFLYFAPNYFVIYDELTKETSDHTTRWLLHTQNKPNTKQMDSLHTFSADEGRGRLFCRTLIPENPHMRLVGGPGKEFATGDWNSGLVNFDQGNNVAEVNGDLWGNWRVEVSSGDSSLQESYCHLIQVGEKNLLSGMISSGNEHSRKIWFVPIEGPFVNCSVTVDFELSPPEISVFAPGKREVPLYRSSADTFAFPGRIEKKNDLEEIWHNLISSMEHHRIP